MDKDPPDNFQMPTPMIKLKSSDGEIFQVEVKVAKLSLHFKEMLDDLGVIENEVISIPQNGPKISGKILGKIILWANHHKDDPAVAEDDEEEEKPTDDISSWDTEFLQVDQTTLFRIIRAANYLNIKGLLDVTCKTVAKVIKEMTLDEVRRTFHIQNDFSPDEEQLVRKEYAWCEGVHFGANHGSLVNHSVMDKIPRDSVQNMNQENNQFVEDCLSNSVVVRKIFEHFSDNDLLKLSFLNKIWNYEARSVLRKRGNLFAHITCTNIVSCPEIIEAFLAATQQMNIVPFAGINFDIRHSEPPLESPGCPNKGLYPFDPIILDQLPLRKVSVELLEKNLDCPGFLMAKIILQEFSEVLEELSLTLYITDEERKFIIEDVVQQCRFPRLKVLKVQDCYYCGPDASNTLVKVLVFSAPNLQQLHTNEPIGPAFNALLEGTSAVVVNTQRYWAPFDEMLEAKIGAFGLENISLFYTGHEFNFERFSQITPALLQASSSTVRSMEVDAVLAVPLMCYGLVFDKVDDLEMRINYPDFELREPRIWRIVKDFDFTRIFPNLNEVRINSAYSTILPQDDTADRIIERANAVLPVPAPDRVVNANIKGLRLCYCAPSIATIEFFAEMFPSIEKLDVEYEEDVLLEEIPFGSIWKHWVGLKNLRIWGPMVPMSGNLDSVFCGIFPEEVAELRQKDEEFLRSVQIVPIMPAITCLKNLRVLRLCSLEHSQERFIDGGTFMFSKVTGFIAFKRCPSLAVSLNFCRDEYVEVTRHLEPFASVTLT